MSRNSTKPGDEISQQLRPEELQQLFTAVMPYLKNVQVERDGRGR